MAKKLTYEELEKQIEDVLSESEQRFKQLIRNSFDMIVLLDTNGIQHYVSESCEYILGYKPEELVNVPVIDQFIHPEDQEKTRTGLLNILNNSNNGGTQYRHWHKNGGWVYLEAFGTNQIDNPSIQSLVLNVRDITERKNAEQALKASEDRLAGLNATKDKLFSIIGHDLRGPFNSIIGFSNLLTNQVQQKDYEGVERYARIIRDSSYRAMDLLTNLLEWSRAQSGKIEFNPEYIELVTVINEVTDLLNDSAQQKSITISQHLPHNLPVFADKDMVLTILRNLISNGIKFTNPGGEIMIRADQQDDRVMVSVADSGVGISEDDFDTLFRMENSRPKPGTQQEKGTGLGLLLCKEFVEVHGGQIWAESTEGAGSVFYFTIPL
ncbi:MAG: PAS domain S-box protein [Bacteroidales bacterium]|nr:PAS domain S-box protein [Bacteroidales bacterium]